MVPLKTIGTTIICLMVLSILGSRPCGCELRELLSSNHDSDDDCCHSEYHQVTLGKGSAESCPECEGCCTPLAIPGSPTGCGGRLAQPAIVGSDAHTGQLALPVSLAVSSCADNQTAAPPLILSVDLPARVTVLSTVIRC